MARARGRAALRLQEDARRRQVRPRRPRSRHRRLPRLRADPAARARGEAARRRPIEEQEPTIDPETGELREPEEPELDPELLAPYEDQITTRDVTPDDFGRIAAQTAKQVILQRIREAERTMMFEEYQDRVGELVTGIIQQSDNRYTLVQLRERVEALLPRSEQVWNERYDHGMRVKAVITDVSAEGKGPSIVVSRRNPELIKKLFALEVPEIADKLVEIVGVAREPGYRSKIAVISHADGVDPVGACVGPRGSRVRMVVSELRGEKIDIIPYNEEPARFVAKALSPARVREVLVDDEDRQATVIVPDDQLSLAIGREGQNARLAAKLTGWRVDIKSRDASSPARRGRSGYEGEEEARRPLRGGALRRAALPERRAAGSRYCGLPQHQALARFDDQPGDRARAAQRRGDREARRPRRRRRRGRGDRRARRGGSSTRPRRRRQAAAEEAARREPRPPRPRTPRTRSRADEAGRAEDEPQRPRPPSEAARAEPRTPAEEPTEAEEAPRTSDGDRVEDGGRAERGRGARPPRTPTAEPRPTTTARGRSTDGRAPRPTADARPPADEGRRGRSRWPRSESMRSRRRRA